MKIIQRIAAIGVALFALAAPAGAQDFLQAKPPSATGSYLAGQQALRQLRTPDAANFFSSALVEGWDNPEILARAHAAFASNGDIDRAADTARRLLEVQPRNPFARLVLGTEALKQRRYPAAIRELERVREGGFVVVVATVLKAWAQVGAGQTAESQRTMAALGGQFETFFLQTRALMADVAGDTPAAIDFVSKAQVAQPYDAGVVEAYARILGNAGRFDDALDAIVMYEARGLSYPPITDLREKLAAGIRPGPYAESVQAGASDILYVIALLLSQDQREFGLMLNQLALHLHPANDRALILLADIYDGAGQHDLANAAYERIAPNSLLKPGAIVAIAGNLNSMGDRPGAIRRLSNMIVSEPDNIAAIMLLGQLHMLDKEYDLAAETYSKALEVTGGKRPADWRVYFARAIALERANRFPEAEEDFLKALDFNPNHPEVLNYLGYSWVDKGMHLERGLELIERAVDNSPGNAAIIDSLGWALYRLGQYEEAVEQLERSLRLDSMSAEVNDHLGDAYWKVGRKLEARFQWRIAISVDEPDGMIAKRAALKLEGGLDAVPPPGSEDDEAAAAAAAEAAAN